jgi:hypothetical protein
MHQVADVARMLSSSRQHFSPAVVDGNLVALRAWKEQPFAILHDIFAANLWIAFEWLRDETVEKGLRVRPVR